MTKEGDLDGVLNRGLDGDIMNEPLSAWPNIRFALEIGGVGAISTPGPIVFLRPRTALLLVNFGVGTGDFFLFC